MPTSYTSLLGLALPVTGELAGQWGTTVNDYITQYVDSSVAGTQTISGTQTAVTLSVTNGSSLVTAGSGSTGSAQFQIINCTGNPAGLLTITAPASSRQYIIINATSTSQSVKIVGSGPTTGVTILSGEKAHVAWNGSDFVKIATQSGNGDFVTVDTTNLEVTNIKAKDGTAAASIADSTGVISITSNPILSGGTANGVLYLNGSKVATSGSALTFDGTVMTNETGAGVYASRDNATLRAYAGSTNGTVVDINSAGTVGITKFSINNSEQMRLTSTGLGIGTSSPSVKLDVRAPAAGIYLSSTTGTNQAALQVNNSGGDFYFGIDNSAGNTFNTGTAYAGVLWRSGANPICFVNNGSEKMRLDSSGNLGLGVTPSAWSIRALQVGSGFAAWSTGNTNARILANTYYDGAYKYVGTGRATQYEQDGYHAWYTAASGTAGNTITFTTAMTLDVSGNLVLGTTAPASARLYIRGSGTTSATASFEASNSSGATRFYVQDDGTTRFFGSSGSETARITSGGDLLVGKTATNAAVVGIQLLPSGAAQFTRSGSTNATSTLDVYSTGASAYRFYVDMAGTIFATSTTISAISDQRFKENIVDLDVGLNAIMALKPRKFDWKAGKGKDKKNDRGFIAQEFEQVFPDLIDEWKDPAPEGEEPYKSVRQDLIPVLVKAIQEQQTIIQSLTARIAALESKGV